MINPKELRIGNYVDHPELGMHKWQFSNDDYGYYEMDEFNPISLSDELFLKFGIEDFKIFPKPNGFVIRFLIGYDMHEYFVLKVPEYVHSLQNLYFALAGDELEMKDLS